MLLNNIVDMEKPDGIFMYVCMYLFRHHKRAIKIANMKQKQKT